MGWAAAVATTTRGEEVVEEEGTGETSWAATFEGMEVGEEEEVMEVDAEGASGRRWSGQRCSLVYMSLVLCIFRL